MLQQLFSGVDFTEILQALSDTLLMLGISIFISAIIGIVLGMLLYLTSKQGILRQPVVYFILSAITNILRSIPFIILIILMMPATVSIMGTSFGIKGVIPSLIVGAFPFIARLVEGSLKELDQGVISMAQSFGASNWQIIYHILLPEILPSIVGSITVTTIALVSYTAMAGAVGGGGLGDLAIRYGYQRYQTNVMIITVVVLIVLVQLIQLIGDKIVHFIKSKKI